MKRLRQRRPSPAIVIALTALVFAMAGPALAGPAERALSQAKRALGIAKKAQRDATRARTAADDAIEAPVVRFRDEPLPSNEFKSIRVECRSKEHVVSGGYKLTGFVGTDIERVYVFTNGPEATEAGETSEAWIVEGVNRTINGGGIRVFALCAR